MYVFSIDIIFEVFTVSFSSAKFHPQTFVGKSLTGTNGREGYTWMFVFGTCKRLSDATLPAADAEVVSKVAATLLKIATLFNPFCIAKIVDCDNFTLETIWIHQTREIRRWHIVKMWTSWLNVARNNVWSCLVRNAHEIH